MDVSIYPHNLEAEESVLGGILYLDDAIHSVLPFLLPDDFYDEDHKKIFSAMIDMAASNIPIDVLSVKEKLMGKYNVEWNDSLILTLVRFDPPVLYEYDPKHVEHWGKIVKRNSRDRSLFKLSRKIGEKIEERNDSNEIIDFFQTEISNLAWINESEVIPIQKILPEMADAFDKQREEQVKSTGFSSGLHSIDKKTGGFQRQELTIISAGVSGGKTAFATNLCRQLKPTTKAAVFSLEQSKEHWLMRMACAQQRLNLFAVRTGAVSQSQAADYHRALKGFHALSIYTKENSSSLNQIVSICKQLKFQKGLDLVIIDYLTLIQHTMPKGQRFEEHHKFAAIVSTLKLLAKELDVAIILLSQLNREYGDYQEPELRQLAQTSQIERDADVVLMIWKKLRKPEETGKAGELQDMITVAKSRNGETGRVQVVFTKECVRFDDFSNQREL